MIWREGNKLVDIAGRRLSLNKRFAIFTVEPISIPAATVNFNAFFANPQTFPLNTNQCFRLISPLGAITDPNATGFLTVNNPSLHIEVNPAAGDVIAQAWQASAVANPIAASGLVWGAESSKLFAASDFAQQLGAAINKVALTIGADVSNSDAAAHNVFFTSNAVVEVFDVWDSA